MPHLTTALGGLVLRPLHDERRAAQLPLHQLWASTPCAASGGLRQRNPYRVEPPSASPRQRRPRCATLAPYLDAQAVRRLWHAARTGRGSRRLAYTFVVLLLWLDAHPLEG